MTDAANKPSHKRTIYDIAAKAGASPSTVSSALNGSWRARRIKAETAERILRIAQEQGYTVNRQAQGLRKARSGLIGLLLPEQENRFFSSLSQNFAMAARRRGLCPTIVPCGRDPGDQADAAAALLSYAADSLMIAGASDPDRLSALCRRAGAPHVFVDQPCAIAPSVVSDNQWAAAQLTERLLERMPPIDAADPRAQLYFVGGEAGSNATMGRIDGFRAALAGAGGEASTAIVIACGYDAMATEAALEALRDRLGGLPAGLLINSIAAFEGALRFFGRLPEPEIAACQIGCYDYDPMGALLRFPVLMVRQRAEELVRVAFEHLDADVDEPRLTLIKPELLAQSDASGSAS